MCTSCYYILDKFTATRNCWIENQSKLKIKTKQEPTEADEVAINVEEFELQLESNDDFYGEYDYRVEYIDEFTETITTDNVIGKEEIVEEEIIEISTQSSPQPQRQNKKLSTMSKRSHSISKKKGKEVYQKLLQKCPICLKMIEKNRMDGHMNKHQNFRPYFCDVKSCNKSFHCKLLCRLHQTTIHTNAQIPCDVCNKAFPSERALYTHKNRHRNANRYKCHVCDKKFNNNNSLTRHLAIHSGIREYTCHFCEANFYRKYNLSEFKIIY